MNGKRHVCVVGSANMDLVVTCERFPVPGETLLADGFATYAGGKGANQAVAAGRLGWPTRFLGKTGNDAFRDQLLESLESAGVDTGSLLVDPEASSGVALITVDSCGQNTILVASGSNMRLTPADLDANRALFDGAGAVLLQLEIPIDTVRRAAELGREAGATVILNPAPAREVPADVLALVDYLTPNETEASVLSGMPAGGRDEAARAALTLVDRGIPNVIVTLGQDGALLADKSGVRHFPAVPIDVVDTTAAGDAFSGALAVRLAAGDPADEGIEFATRVSALCVARRGAQDAMPTADEVESVILSRTAED